MRFLLLLGLQSHDTIHPFCLCFQPRQNPTTTTSPPHLTHQHITMSHARIEEVSDSDPSEGDISDVSDDFDEREILRARPSAVPKPQVAPSLINPSNIPSASPRTQTAPDGTQFVQADDQSKYASFECLYPVYFDVSRSRREGRMVGKELAVENPLAREIVNACGRLGLETLFEPTKIHPKDWSNPGRVKIKLKGGRNTSIKNSTSHLLPRRPRRDRDLLLTSFRTPSLYFSIRPSESQSFNSSHCFARPRARHSTS